MAGVVEGEQGLAALEASARHDLARLNYPPASWVPGRAGPDGKPALDVLVVGAGMCGQTVGFGLRREGIRNIRVIERESHGREGPWNTTARMPILRSPKHLTGPDLGIPSLTFRAWYEAQVGQDAWEQLGLIPRADWMACRATTRKAVLSIARIANTTTAKIRTLPLFCAPDRSFVWFIILPPLVII